MSEMWIQVLGTFNPNLLSGAFIAVQPALPVNMLSEHAESELSLSAETKDGAQLETVPIDVDFGSCDDVIEEGTFQVFLKMPEGADILRLFYQGQELAVYEAPGAAPEADGFGLGARRGHAIPLTHTGAAESNVTYMLQARETGRDMWQTLDVGLERLEAGEVDINQFPNARELEVRVLRSSGFGAEEIDRTKIKFGE